MKLDRFPILDKVVHVFPYSVSPLVAANNPRSSHRLYPAVGTQTCRRTTSGALIFSIGPSVATTVTRDRSYAKALQKPSQSVNGIDGR
jgi:hypothetical protein